MTNRTLIALNGPDRVAFLQGLVTNDVADTRPDRLVYAALLTPQGKFIADFFVLHREDSILLDVAATHAPLLAQRLNMYRLRSAVEIADSPLRVQTGTGGLADPRHPALPQRSYGALSGTPDPLQIRVDHIIPATGIELTPDTYILEAGFERLNGVSFTKGCYIGQEIVARMKHKTKLKKGLVRLDITGEAPIGTPITKDDRPSGMLYSQSNGKAIAHMRFDRIGGDLRADQAVLRAETA